MSSNRLITDTFRTTKKLKQTSNKQKKNDGVRQIKLDTKQQSQVPIIKSKQDEEKGILKSFDLNCDFGPCIGISRMERWERAQDYNLDPPQDVHDIISQHPQDLTYTQSVWYDYQKIL